MLKKKKQNVYFRFGLKPQQGYLVATYVLPREEHKGKTLSVFYQTALDLDVNIFKVMTTLSNVNKTIELDNSLALGILLGSFDTANNLSGPLRRSHFDEMLDNGHGMSQYVYVNEKKEIVYRYPDGFVTIQENEVKISETPNILFGPTAVDVEYSVNYSNSRSLEIKERIYEITGEEKETTTIMSGKITSFSQQGTRTDIGAYDELGEYYLIQRGNTSYTGSFGDSMVFGLNPMGTIFIENTSYSLNPDPEDNWQSIVSITGYTIADKNNEITLSPATFQAIAPPLSGTEDRVVIQSIPARTIPTYVNDSVAARFAKNYNSWNPYPAIIKANDKDVYLMETEGGGCIVVKEGIDYPIAPTSFVINDVQYDLLDRDFVDFFCASSMMQCKWFSETRQSGYYEEYPEFKPVWQGHFKHTFFDFDQLFPYGDSYDRQYMITSWFGNYLYRVRIDEFIEEPYWTQELDWIINAWDSEYRTNDRNTKKGPAEALGVVGGAFFFDILQKNKTLTNMRIISDFMKDYAPVGQMLKIYQPGTNKLWVEKFRLDIKEGTASLVYVERFQVPFLSPVETQTKGGLNFDIQTTEEFFTRMKSICYVPYDYVPPVEN